MHYHVGHNTPGHMPESDVDTVETIDQAIDLLLSDLEMDIDSTYMWGECDHAAGAPCDYYGDHCSINARRDLGSLVSYLTEDRAITVESGSFLGHADNYAWWIEPCSDDCDMEDEL